MDVALETGQDPLGALAWGMGESETCRFPLPVVLCSHAAHP
jgi:hypothetical protein